MGVCFEIALGVGGDEGVVAGGEDVAGHVAAEGAEAVAVKSPFDFERHMRVFVASDVPLPSPGEAKLALDVLADGPEEQEVHGVISLVAGNSILKTLILVLLSAIITPALFLALDTLRYLVRRQP